jgi:hypothetical protein
VIDPPVSEDAKPAEPIPEGPVLDELFTAGGQTADGTYWDGTAEEEGKP